MYLQLPVLDLPYVKHGFSTRQGGVSSDSYASLNLKLPSTDNEDLSRNVLENRFRLCQGMGMKSDALVACQQVHGDHIYQVQSKDKGRGAFLHHDGIPDCDGLLTDQCDIPLLIMVADCVPLLLADPVRKVVGALHAGWRGTQKKILSKALGIMREEYGCLIEDIRVGIGACIGFDAFEVGAEVAHAFESDIDLENPEIAFQKGDKFHLNLQEINRLQAVAFGINPSQIAILKHCTFSDENLFFSYRRDQGITGRLAAVIGIQS